MLHGKHLREGKAEREQRKEPTTPVVRFPRQETPRAFLLRARNARPARPVPRRSTLDGVRAQPGAAGAGAKPEAGAGAEADAAAEAAPVPAVPEVPAAAARGEGLCLRFFAFYQEPLEDYFDSATVTVRRCILRFFVEDGSCFILAAKSELTEK